MGRAHGAGEAVVGHGGEAPACGLVSAASVATRATVVAGGRPPLMRTSSASGGTLRGLPWPPNSAPTSHGAAQKCGPSPTVALPTALTTASAPTVKPWGVAVLADPSPPL
jgi:hypothetical protein